MSVSNLLSTSNNPSKLPALLLPKMSESNKNELLPPVKGMLLYNSDNNDIQYYNGSDWLTLTSGTPTNNNDCFSCYLTNNETLSAPADLNYHLGSSGQLTVINIVGFTHTPGSYYFTTNKRGQYNLNALVKLGSLSANNGTSVDLEIAIAWNDLPKITYRKNISSSNYGVVETFLISGQIGAEVGDRLSVSISYTGNNNILIFGGNDLSFGYNTQFSCSYAGEVA